MFNINFSSFGNDLTFKVTDEGMLILSEEGKINLKLRDDELVKLLFVISSYLQDKGK